MINSTIKILRHNTKKTITDIKSELKDLKNTSKFQNLDLEIYRKKILILQDQLNKNQYVEKIFNQIKYQVYKYLQDENVLVQTFLYLRSSRPIKRNIIHDMDSVPFHRESFYGKNMKMAFNIWTPILGSETPKALAYVPNSHKIPDKKIKFYKTMDKFTKKKSSGHKLGFLYQPKKISYGVNFNKARSMKVPFYNSAIFSGNLIHGPNHNYSKNIRVSLDFKIIKKKDYRVDQKKHITSSRSYFEEF